jgi:hypothetical protein
MSHLNFLYLTNRHEPYKVAMHKDVLRYQNGYLEADHRYIQWMFPTLDKSLFNLTAPVLDDYSIAAIRQHPDAIANFYGGLARMQKFYETTHNWHDPDDHNQLRISRILTSTTLLIDEATACQFLSSIRPNVVNPHWSQWV